MKRAKKPMILAGRLERIFANLIDTLLLFVLLQVLLQLLGETPVMLVTSFLTYAVYFTLSTGSSWQASPAQRLLSIYVVHANGRPLSMADALQRFLAYIIPSLPMQSSFLAPAIAMPLVVWLQLVWFLPILVKEDRTGVHDMLCHTRVVAGKAPRR